MIDGLKPYPEYKDSDQPWLGKCPKHWSQRRMKFLFTERVQKGFPDEPLLAATQSKGVVRKSDYGERTVTASKDFHLLKLVEPDDYVISLRSFQGGIEVAHCRGIISPAYTILAPKNESRGGYFTHFFKSPDFIRSLTLFVTGIREGQNVDYVRMSRAYLPLPPVDEQAAIVRFLDHANGRIERAIRAKKKLMALLHEQKQAIIHRAVTRGLNPNAPLKPSGIPWLGDIPKHWEVLRSKYVFREVDDRSATGQELRLSMCQKRGLIPSSEIEVKRLVSESAVGAKICEAGDLVLNRLKAHLGVFALASVRGLVSPDYTILRPARPMFPRYFELIYRTPACRVELRKRAKGIVQGFWRLYTDDFYDIRVPVPSVSEQEKIVTQLDADLATLNTALARAEREIGLLREYRTRLVADVVTGKLDVRAAAAKLPAETEIPVENVASDELAEETETEEAEA
jgi:type I restriction enzyme S subunit